MVARGAVVTQESTHPEAGLAWRELREVIDAERPLDASDSLDHPLEAVLAE
jgi:hypothetical protein